MKIEPGGNILVDPTKYEHYSLFLHPSLSEKNDAEEAVLELKLNAHSISRITPSRYSVFEKDKYLANIVFAISEGVVSVKQFEEDLIEKIASGDFDYRYANLCEILAYCDIKTSWHKDTFLVPGTFYQDENLHRYAIRCSVGKVPMFDPRVTVEIKSWAPQAKIGNGRKIPLVKTERKKKG